MVELQYADSISYETVRRTLKKLVIDNLSTHGPSALYEKFEPSKAKRIWDRFEFIFTPKYGSWLNIAPTFLFPTKTVIFRFFVDFS